MIQWDFAATKGSNPQKGQCLQGFSNSEIIPTRSWNSYLKQLGLDDISSDSSDCFDYPYYHSYTMDAYQNLISGDKPPWGVHDDCCGWFSCIIA